MTRLTAYEIAQHPNDVIATHEGPNAQGLYRGRITRDKKHQNQLLVLTEPVYSTPQLADDAMKEEIASAAEWAQNDPENSRSPLIDVF